MTKREFAVYIPKLSHHETTEVGSILIQNNLPGPEYIYNVQVNISYEVPDKKEDAL